MSLMFKTSVTPLTIEDYRKFSQHLIVLYILIYSSRCRTFLYLRTDIPIFCIAYNYFISYSENTKFPMKSNIVNISGVQFSFEEKY